MNEKITKLEKVRDELISSFEEFPENKNAKIFDKWSLKDIISHLNNWINHDIDCINSLKSNNEPYWEPDVDIFNQKGVEERSQLSYEAVFNEFKHISQKLIESYKNLNEEDWNKKFWEDKPHTPEMFINEDINHWILHLKEIKSVNT